LGDFFDISRLGANRKMAGAEPPQIYDHMYEIDDTGLPYWLKDEHERQHAGALRDLGLHERLADFLVNHAYNKLTDANLSGNDEESDKWYPRSCQADDYLKAVQQHADTQPKEANRRAQATFKQYLAEINRLAADNSGSPYNPGAGSGVIPDTKYFPTNTPGAGGIGADRVNKGGQFNDGIKIDTSHAQIDEAPPVATTTEGIGVDGFGQPDMGTSVGRMDSDNTLIGGGGSFGDNSTSQGEPEAINGTPSLKSGGKVYASNLAMIDKLADWTKYDGPDPINDMGKSKPASTSVAKPPKDWATRLPKGDPSKKGGTWTPPTIPRKKK